MKLSHAEVKAILDEGYDRFCRPDFIETDPISIPHRFATQTDREVSGFLAATLAWGQRPTLLRNANDLMRRMDHAPFDFVMNHTVADLEAFNGFVHRTFNATDAKTFIGGLKAVYTQYGNMEAAFLVAYNDQTPDLGPAIHHFRKVFLTAPHLPRTRKHVADPMAGSSAKRINMFLRWMVRNDKRGVDFGLWQKIPPAALSCPLDVHSGRVARALGLLTRPTDDRKAVLELDAALRTFNHTDPVRYDFALYGLGMSGAMEKPVKTW